MSLGSSGFVQDRNLLSSDEPEVEPHLEHDILSFAGSLILGGEFLGASRVVSGEEYDSKSCTGAPMLLQLLHENRSAVGLLMKDDGLLIRDGVEERREFELPGVVAAWTMKTFFDSATCPAVTDPSSRSVGAAAISSSSCAASARSTTPRSG